MRRVIDNIIKNSIESINNDGIIKITTYDEEDISIISIKDNGCGIQEEIMKNLFTPLNTSKSNGTGLGLSYSKKVVELHKGKISVESKLGDGTKVIIMLPRIRLDKKTETTLSIHY